MDKLVKALRETDFGDTCVLCEHEDMCKGNDCIIIQAADAIEELSTELECLKSYMGEYKAAYILEHDARIAECKRELTEKEQEAHNAFLKMAARCGQAEPPKEET